MDVLDRMLGHDAWATGLVLEQSSGLSDEQLVQPFDIGLGNLRETVTHLVYVIEFWTSNIEQRPIDLEWAARPDITVLTRLHDRFHARFAAAARAARDESRLDELFTDVNGYPQSIGATVVHLLYHTAIHRSEAQHMLRRLGVELQLDGDPQEWEYGMRERGLI